MLPPMLVFPRTFGFQCPHFQTCFVRDVHPSQGTMLSLTWLHSVHVRPKVRQLGQR